MAGELDLARVAHGAIAIAILARLARDLLAAPRGFVGDVLLGRAIARPREDLEFGAATVVDPDAMTVVAPARALAARREAQLADEAHAAARLDRAIAIAVTAGFAAHDVRCARVRRRREREQGQEQAGGADARARSGGRRFHSLPREGSHRQQCTAARPGSPLRRPQ